MARDKIKKLEDKIGIRFRNKKYVLAAITHPSHPTGSIPGNSASLNFQRLEFLGDSVLDFYVANKLYELFPQADEGVMSRLRSTLVSKKLLARIAESIRLINFLLVADQGQLPIDIAREKILADSFEALIAAIYLDRGMKKTIDFLEARFEKHFDEKKLFKFDPNPKSVLQEYVQKRFRTLPSYITGLRHRNLFTAWVTIQGTRKTKGEGRTVREAEAHAASKLLKKLKVKLQSFRPSCQAKEIALKN
jgi:ribonuclease-3